MATNFYFIIRAEMNIYLTINGGIKERILEKLKYTFDEATKIHIAKRSVGRYPTFQKTEHFSSVKEIKKFYEDNKNHLDIMDEYGAEYTIEELQTELFDWGKNNPDIKERNELLSGHYLDDEGNEFIENYFF